MVNVEGCLKNTRRKIRLGGRKFKKTKVTNLEGRVPWGTLVDSGVDPSGVSSFGGEDSSSRSQVVLQGNE